MSNITEQEKQLINQINHIVSNSSKDEFKIWKKIFKEEMSNNNSSMIAVEDTDNWISVKDELPKHEQIVDIYTNTEEGQKRITDCMYCDYEEDKGTTKHFYDERYDYIYTLRNVSHWMPLPEPPQQRNVITVGFVGGD